MLKMKQSTKRLILLGLLPALAACSVGPDFKKPLNQTPAAFTRDTHLESVNPNPNNVDTKWWQEYGSTEINQLVELALKNNPNIEAGLANLEIAQQNVRAQQGFFFPQIGAGYSLTRQKAGTYYQPALNSVPPSSDPNNPPASQFALTNPIYNIQTAGLSVGFVPDIWGGNRRAVEGLKASANAQSYQLAALQITIANNVVSSAINEALLREQLNAVHELADLSKRALDHAIRLHEAGYYSAVDLAYAKSTYAQSIAQVPVIEKAREQNLDLLATLCGKYPSEKMLVPSLETIKEPATLPSSIPSKFIAQRPDIKIAEENIRIANAQIGIAIANMLPQFNITGSWGAASEFFSGLQDSGNVLWSLAAGVNQPIFQGGTLFARKRAAQAGLVAAAAQYKGVVQTAFQNVSDTLYAIDADGRFYKTALQNEQANKVVYDQTARQLKVGYISEPAALQAQVSYLQARIASLQAYGTYLGDTAALYQALGGGWSEGDGEIYHQTSSGLPKIFE
jgi:NodT family efflux transporter outer membrane factor (OMF) lipoprotein